MQWIVQENNTYKLNITFINEGWTWMENQSKSPRKKVFPHVTVNFSK
jgi:hypothetical protein